MSSIKSEKYGFSPDGTEKISFPVKDSEPFQHA